MGLIWCCFNLVFAISVLFLGQNFAHQELNSDGFYLETFLQKMGIPSENSNFNGPVCSWKGVSCNNQNGNILSLVLRGVGLSGSIAENTIGKITTLVSLDLSSNFITGFSSDFWGLGYLKDLNLSSNLISGPIPNNIGNFGFLNLLDLSTNNFSGTIPADLNSLQSLRILNLAHNELQGELPSISTLRSLVYLNLSGNKIDGSVMNLRNNSLQIVDLKQNNLQGKIFEALFDWSALIFLDLSSNLFDDWIPSNLSRPHIKHLNLADNSFFPYRFPNIGKLRHLEYLNLSRTSLTGPISSEIANLSSLKVLDLSGNFLTGKVPPLNNRITKLDLSWNNLSGEIPSILQKNLWKMEKFNFSCTNITICYMDNLFQTFPSAFLGSVHNCTNHVPNIIHKSKRFAFVIAIAISVCSMVAGIICLAFALINKCRDPQDISGPFLFRTGSSTWVADIKLATLIPVILLGRPLLNITFADLLNSTLYFDQDFLQAEDRYGPVYTANLPCGIHLILKILINSTKEHMNTLELDNLGKIRHPNLIPLAGYCLAGSRVILIYDYMDNVNLYNWLHDLGRVTEDEDHTVWHRRLGIAIGTARALAFLHNGCSPPIIHGDVKSSNVYLDVLFGPRLAYLGLTTIRGEDYEYLNEGSLGYLLPEYAHPWSATSMSDVYCFGVVLFELVTGKKPMGDDYPGCNEQNLVGWVRQLMRENCASKAIDSKLLNGESLLQMETALRIGYLCTAEAPFKRPNMQQIVGLLKDIEPSIGE